MFACHEARPTDRKLGGKIGKGKCKLLRLGVSAIQSFCVPDKKRDRAEHLYPVSDECKIILLHIEQRFRSFHMQQPAEI